MIPAAPSDLLWILTPYLGPALVATSSLPPSASWLVLASCFCIQYYGSALV